MQKARRNGKEQRGQRWEQRGGPAMALNGVVMGELLDESLRLIAVKPSR
jgi:hypothetical protein